jgi:pSer/pThr/pTyr-binding forkhead associated (FHA) protein
VSTRQVELIVRRTNEPDRRVVLQPGVTHLGRAEDNEVVLPDIGISRRHARIHVGESQVRVEDFGSGNGTFFRGQRVESQVLSDGDEVMIDPFVVVVRITGAVPAGLDDDETQRAQEGDALAGAPARLVVIAGHRLAPAYPLGGAPVSMGRSEARDIVLFDPAASRNHAHVELRADGYWLVDFGSANGTQLNGERVREKALRPGDRIRIGSTELRFELNPNTASAPAPAPASARAPAPPPRPPTPPPATRPQPTPTISQAPAVQAPPAPPPPMPIHTGVPLDARPTAPEPPQRSGVSTVHILLAGVLGFIFFLVLVVIVVLGFIVYKQKTAPAAPPTVEGGASLQLSRDQEAELDLQAGRTGTAGAAYHKVQQADPSPATWYWHAASCGLAEVG